MPAMTPRDYRAENATLTARNEALEIERGRLDEILALAPAFIAVLRGPEHHFERINPLYSELVGNRIIVGKSVREALPEVVDQGFVTLLDEVYSTGKPYVGNAVSVFLIAADGTTDERILDFLYQPLTGEDGSVVGIFVHGVDRTAHHRAERALAERIQEVDRLNARLENAMWETHHRVKNNLQVLSSMIEMRILDHTQDDAIPMGEFVRLKAHILALAVTHDILTDRVAEDEHSQRVSARAILEKLLPILRHTSGGRTLRYTVEDAWITTKQSMALVLVLNELVSNACKHGRQTVQILFQASDSEAQLVVSDDGPGFPTGFDPAIAANTGLDLVNTLTTIDLQGTLTFTNCADGGGVVTLTLPTPTDETRNPEQEG